MTKIPAPYGDQALTPGQLAALRSACRAKEERLAYIVGLLVGDDSLRRESDLTLTHWQEVRDACYPAWKDGDWESRDGSFNDDLAEASRRYADEVEGQERLFER